jgi:hypothetical protein
MTRSHYLIPIIPFLAAACGADEVGGVSSSVTPDLSCTIPTSQIVSGGPGIDGIPALHNPFFVSPADPDAAYLRDDDRVIGLVIDETPYAIPLNILWWHEIVNLDIADLRLAVTHCPLTGSSLVFDRSAIDGLTLGVSGLLFKNNLLMYDRDDPISLWPQMLRGARCGRKAGTGLPMVPGFEMTWGAWRALHPATQVVSSESGFGRDYQEYPYGDYDREDNANLLFPMPVDRRRPPKERVLGIPGRSDAGLALPFGVLNDVGARATVPVTLDDRSVVVFWDRLSRSAVAFETQLDGQTLTFGVVNGRFVDDGGSTWRLDGLATDGPLAGTRLTPLSDAFVAYWFAWAAFYPEAALWTGVTG